MLPKPKQGESKEDFLARCLADSAMMAKYPGEKERRAAAMRRWEENQTMLLKNVLAVLKEIAGAPAEFQLFPAGKIEFTGYPPAYLDEGSAAEIIAAFRADGNDMVIDYEHQTLGDGQAPAAGWIKNLTWRGEAGLWAAAEWTQRARDYLAAKEYRYFSPVALAREPGRQLVKLINVALTNNPATHNLRPLVAKMQQSGSDFVPATQNEKEASMLKLKQLLGLATDAAETKVEEALTLLVNKAQALEAQVAGLVACKEVLEALGAKTGAGKDEVVRIVASLKAPGDAAVQLSHEVAALKTKLAAMEQTDLVALALKEGKTSPAELDKWGLDLAGKNPDQFRLIVLSRPAGSVIPVEGIIIAKDQPAGALDDTQKQVNKMMGIDDETFKKYNK